MLSLDLVVNTAFFVGTDVSSLLERFTSRKDQ